MLISLSSGSEGRSEGGKEGRKEEKKVSHSF